MGDADFILKLVSGVLSGGIIFATIRHIIVAYIHRSSSRRIILTRTNADGRIDTLILEAHTKDEGIELLKLLV